MSTLLEPDSSFTRASRAGGVAPTTFTSAASVRGRQDSRARHVALWVAVIWLGTLAGVAVLADLLPLHDPNARVAALPANTPAGLRWPEPAGTDFVGRSMLSRSIYGARQSLIIGAIAVTVSTAAGTIIGLIAGYARGATDAAIRAVVDAFLAFPPLILLIAVAAIGSRSLTTVVVALSLLGVPSFARLARANVLPLTRREHVLAAQTMGATRSRIIFREILPYVMLPIMSVAFLYMAVIIVAEGSLSFLGLGIPSPAPSWGGMVNEGRSQLATHPQLVVVPSVCLIATVLSLNVLGDQLRRRVDRGRSALL